MFATASCSAHDIDEPMSVDMFLSASPLAYAFVMVLQRFTITGEISNVCTFFILIPFHSDSFQELRSVLIPIMMKSKLKTLRPIRSKYLLLIVISGPFDVIVMVSIGHYARKLKSSRHQLQRLLRPALTELFLVETRPLPLQRVRHHVVFINTRVVIQKHWKEVLRWLGMYCMSRFVYKLLTLV